MRIVTRARRLPIADATVTSRRRPTRKPKGRRREEWTRAIERMMDDEGARREAAEKGRRFADAEHGEARLAERWDSALASVGVGAGVVATPAGAARP